MSVSRNHDDDDDGEDEEQEGDEGVTVVVMMMAMMTIMMRDAGHDITSSSRSSRLRGGRPRLVPVVCVSARALDVVRSAAERRCRRQGVSLAGGQCGQASARYGNPHAAVQRQILIVGVWGGKGARRTGLALEGGGGAGAGRAGDGPPLTSGSAIQRRADHSPMFGVTVQCFKAVLFPCRVARCAATLRRHVVPICCVDSARRPLAPPLRATP